MVFSYRSILTILLAISGPSVSFAQQMQILKEHKITEQKQSFGDYLLGDAMGNIYVITREPVSPVREMEEAAGNVFRLYVISGGLVKEPETMELPADPDYKHSQGGGKHYFITQAGESHNLDVYTYAEDFSGYTKTEISPGSVPSDAYIKDVHADDEGLMLLFASEVWNSATSSYAGNSYLARFDHDLNPIKTEKISGIAPEFIPPQAENPLRVGFDLPKTAAGKTIRGSVPVDSILDMQKTRILLIPENSYPIAHASIGLEELYIFNRYLSPEDDEIGTTDRELQIMMTSDASLEDTLWLKRVRCIYGPDAEIAGVFDDFAIIHTPCGKNSSFYLADETDLKPAGKYAMSSASLYTSEYLVREKKGWILFNSRNYYNEGKVILLEYIIQ